MGSGNWSWRRLNLQNMMRDSEAMKLEGKMDELIALYLSSSRHTWKEGMRYHLGAWSYSQNAKQKPKSFVSLSSVTRRNIGFFDIVQVDNRHTCFVHILEISYLEMSQAQAMARFVLAWAQRERWGYDIGLLFLFEFFGWFARIRSLPC